MSITTRMILILMLTLPAVGKLVAQEATTTTETAATTTAAATETAETTGTTATAEGGEAAETTTGTTTATTAGDADNASYETRNAFTRLLHRHPEELATLLVLDPSLLENQQFVSRYPELARFLERHPEVVSAPRFYLAEFGYRAMRNGPLENILEPIMVLGAFLLATFALGWFIRTLIEQRRWNKLSKTQSEVHNKILDRFGTSSELLEYVKSPAGAKFLESAPIPLHVQEAPAPRANAPLQRVLWTVQAGVVLGALGLGLLLISLRFADRGEGMFALGAISLCIGGGFIASAAVSLFLSRRLGLWNPSESAPGPGSPTGDRYDVS